MKPYSILAAVAFTACFAAAPEVGAQVEASGPIKIVPSKPVQPLKEAWTKAQVVSFTTAAITVQEPKERLKIHTLSFSPELREKMANLLDQGGYQTGDRAKIQYVPQASIATDIRGKLSKSP